MKECSGGSDAAAIIAVAGADESVLRLLQIKLARAGYTVLTASDRARGLGLLSRSPSLVLLDSSLPHGGALEIARSASRLARQERPAVVLISDDASPASIELALRCGCDDYVIRPFSTTELVHRLRVVLIRHALERAEDGAARPVPS